MLDTARSSPIQMLTASGSLPKASLASSRNGGTSAYSAGNSSRRLSFWASSTPSEPAATHINTGSLSTHLVR